MIQNLKSIFLIYLICFHSIEYVSSACTSTQCTDNEGNCQTAKKFQLISTTGNLCTNYCLSTECYHPTLFKCILLSSLTNIIAEEVGGKCVTKTAEKISNCIDSSLDPPTSIAATTGKLANLDGDICTSTCKDVSKCYLTTTSGNYLAYVCYNSKDLGKVSDGLGGACADNCGSSSGLCMHPTTKQCLAETSLITAATANAGDACICTDTTMCVSPTLNKCVKPSKGLISNGDGTTCTNICNTISKCYNPATFQCQTAASGLLSNSDGGECTTACNKSSFCYDNTTYTCIEGTTSKYPLEDGAACSASCPADKCFDSSGLKLCISPVKGKYFVDNTSACYSSCDSGYCVHPKLFKCLAHGSDFNNSLTDCHCTASNKCLNPSGIDCISPAEGLIDDGDGSVCKSKCTSSTQCFHPATFICQEKIVSEVTIMSTVIPGGVCYCADNQATHCVDPDTTNCIAATSGKVADGDGSICKTSCSNTKMCHINNICQFPTSGNVSNNNGAACATNCTDMTKCWDTIDYLCKKPSVGRLLATGGEECVKKCGNGKCWHPGTFTCVDLGTSLFETENGETGGKCKCIDNAKCIDLTGETCNTPDASNISDNDGSICKSACSDSAKCFHPSTFICYDKGTLTTITTGGSCYCPKADFSTKCIDVSLSTPTCIAGASGKLVKKDGGACGTACATNECYKTTDYICNAGASNGKVHDSNDGRACVDTCADTTNFCWNPVTFICVDATGGATFTNPTGGNACVCVSDKCIDTDGTCVSPTSTKLVDKNTTSVCVTECSNGYCHHEGTNICLEPTSNSLELDINKKCICLTDKTTKCLPISSNTCVTGSSTLIVDGDGSLCKSNCTDTNKCFHPSTGICQETTANLMELTQVGAQCVASDKTKCIGSASITPVSGSSGNIVNGDGGSCTTACKKTNQCFDSTTYKCQTPDSSHISTGSGAVCALLTCTGSQCYHPKTYECFTPDSSFEPYDTAAECRVLAADVATKCIDNDSNTVITAKLGKLTLKNGKACASSCLSTDCYDSTTFACQTPASGKISNGDGGACQASSCTDTSKCVNSSFICITPTSSNRLKQGVSTCNTDNCADSGFCINPDGTRCLAISTIFTKDGVTSNCKCTPISKCISNNTCITPELGKLGLGDGTECQATAPSGKCYHPSSFILYATTANFIADPTTGECVCVDTNKCLDPTDSTDTGTFCITPSDPKVANGDGKICSTTTCSDIKKCFDSTTRVCITGESGKLADGDGSVCKASCTDTTQCWHPGSFKCMDTLINSFTSVTDGGQCTCKDSYLCIEKSGEGCINGVSGNINNLNGGLCTTACTDVNQCYTTNFVCTDASYSQVSNGDGGACSTACTDSAKCWSPVDFKCMTPVTDMNSTTSGAMCSCTTTSAKCIDSANTCASTGCYSNSFYQKIWISEFNKTYEIQASTIYCIGCHKIGMVIANASGDAVDPTDIDDSTKKANTEVKLIVDRNRTYSNLPTTSATYPSDGTQTNLLKFIPNMFGYKEKKSFVAYDITYTCGVSKVEYKIKYFDLFTKAKAFYDSIDVANFNKVLSNGDPTLEKNFAKLNSVAIKTGSTITTTQLEEIFIRGIVPGSC